MFPAMCCDLSAPLNRSNVVLFLLHPLSRYRTPSAIGDRECDWEALSLRISHSHTGRSSQPPHAKPPRKLNRASVAL